MFALSLSAAVGSLVLFTITRMKVNAAGTKLWATGLAFFSIAYCAQLLSSEHLIPDGISHDYICFFHNISLLSGHALLLAGTWHYVGYLMPTSRMAVLFIPIVILTFLFTFIWPDSQTRLAIIGIWLVIVRSLYAWALWFRVNAETYERKVAIIAVLMALIEILCTAVFAYYYVSGLGGIDEVQSGTLAVVSWLGALIGIMVGAPLLMLLSTSRFISALDTAAHIDPLTGLLNRRGFYESAKSLLSLKDRQKVNVGVLMLDVDWFKRVNDSFGHLVGDSILEKLGIILKTEKRESDLGVRWGGEEFCILAYDISASELEKLANRIRLKFSSETEKMKALKDDKLTISVGVACSNAEIRNFEDLQKQADEALYQAKHVAGKDCVKFYCEPMSSD
ncbi:MAG: sensor domain-containing diguanylate cyclase [Gammaproteobacteria bacterium]|nr:sensor domain-containing diguanylate cyclase [Gammaproteobacteria bacterium]